MKKRLLILILIAAMAAALCVPVLAEDAGEPAQSAGEISGSAADPTGEAPEEDDYDPFDAQELSSMILELFARKKINPERIGVTYCYTPTGETCSVNGR